MPILYSKKTAGKQYSVSVNIDKMPKSCCECPFFYDASYYGNWECFLNGFDTFHGAADSIPDSCPLFVNGVKLEPEPKKVTARDVSEITLLSSEEYEKYGNAISVLPDEWWLRSSDDRNAYYAFYHGVCYNSVDGLTCDYGIRPAFRIPNLESQIGSKVIVGCLLCTVIDKNYALSDSIVSRRQFGKPSNGWEKSKLKSYIESKEFFHSIGL